MKNIIVLITVSFIATSNLLAQDFTLGLKAGYGAYSQDYHFKGDSYRQSPQAYSYTGMNAGVFGILPLNKRFSFQPELLYSEKGSHDRDLYTTFEMKYLDLPLLMKLHMGAFSIYAGPYLGFLLQAKETYLFNDNVTDIFKTVDYGFQGGFQLDFKMGLILGGRIERGLADLDNLDSDDLRQHEDGIRNYGINAYIGWKIHSF